MLHDCCCNRLCAVNLRLIAAFRRQGVVGPQLADICLLAFAFRYSVRNGRKFKQLPDCGHNNLSLVELVRAVSQVVCDGGGEYSDWTPVAPNAELDSWSRVGVLRCRDPNKLYSQSLTTATGDIKLSRSLQYVREPKRVPANVLPCAQAHSLCCCLCMHCALIDCVVEGTLRSDPVYWYQRCQFGMVTKAVYSRPSWQATVGTKKHHILTVCSTSGSATLTAKRFSRNTVLICSSITDAGLWRSKRRPYGPRTRQLFPTCGPF